MCKMHACNPVATVSVNKLSLFLLEKLGQWCLLCARAFWRRLLRRLLLNTSTTTATLGSRENEKNKAQMRVIATSPYQVLTTEVSRWQLQVTWALLILVATCWATTSHSTRTFFAFPRVKWLHLTGDVDKSVKCSCHIFSGFNIPKIIKTGW